MKGKARSDSRKTNKQKDEEDRASAATTISLDYTYITEKSDDTKEKVERKKPFLVMYDRKSKSIIGHLANCKGTGDEWLVKRVVTDIEDLGYSSVRSC